MVWAEKRFEIQFLASSFRFTDIGHITWLEQKNALKFNSLQAVLDSQILAQQIDIGQMKKGWRVQSYLISIANNISPNKMHSTMDLALSHGPRISNSIENVNLYLLCSKICQLNISLYNQSLIRCSKTGCTRCVFNILKYNRLFIHI